MPRLSWLVKVVRNSYLRPHALNYSVKDIRHDVRQYRKIAFEQTSVGLAHARPNYEDRAHA